MKTNQKKVSWKIQPAYVILGLILVFFGRNIFPVNGNFIGGTDVANYFFWNAQFTKQQLLSASVPLWNPYYYSGHPFIANPQTFVFYPATLLFLLIPLPWAFNIDTILHIFLAAMGMYCFASLIAESKSAALASAVVYSLGGYFMDNILAGHLTMIHTAALLPWIFYFSEKGYKTNRMRFFLIAGVVLGLQILSGEPQNNYYTALFLTIYFSIRYLFTSKPARPKPLYRLGIFLILVFLVAFGISAVQILPSLEFMSLSDRTESTYRFVIFGSFPLQNFFTFLIPKIKTPLLATFWEWGGYLGIFSIILACIGAVFSRHRHYTWCLGIIALIAITIMMGRHTPIFPLYYKLLPGFSLFRIPARCLVIFVFSISVFAGLGVRFVCDSAASKKQYLAAIILWAVLLLHLFAGASNFQVPLASRQMLFSIAFFLCALVILILSRFVKNKSIIAGLIIAALFIDLYLTYSSQTPKTNQSQLLKKQPYELLPEKDPNLYRVASSIDGVRGVRFYCQNVNGYTPVALGSYFRFMHEMADVPTAKATRHTLNTQLFTPDLVFSSKVLNIKYAVVKTEKGFGLFTTDQIMPRAVLVDNAVVLPRLQDHLNYMKKPDFNPRQQVLLETAPDKNAPPNLKAAQPLPDSNSVEITKYLPNRIELKAVSNCDTYLVLSELFYPGWHVYIDGSETQILRADYLLRAIPLTAGRHNIVFVYRPAGFLLGAALTIFTILALACLWLSFFALKFRIASLRPQ